MCYRLRIRTLFSLSVSEVTSAWLAKVCCSSFEFVRLCSLKGYVAERFRTSRYLTWISPVSLVISLNLLMILGYT
jgi:hypothetical protein